MNEKDPIIIEPIVEEPTAITEGNTPNVDIEAQKKTDSHEVINVSWSKNKLLEILMFAWLSFLISCDSNTIGEKRDKLRWITPAQRNLKNQIENFKKERKAQEDLKRIEHILEIKIGDRKMLVEKYNDKLNECKEYPNDYETKERTLLVLNRLVECNNEILSYENQRFNTNKELCDIRSILSNELPTWRIYTDPNFFDDILDELKEQKNDVNTAYFPDYVDDGNIEHIENEIEQ